MKTLLGFMLLFGFWPFQVSTRKEGFEKYYVEFLSDYFLERGIRSVTSMLCQSTDINVQLQKAFSSKSIKSNWINLDKLPESAVLEYINSKMEVIGIIVDLKCHRSLQLLEMASKHNLFIFEIAPIYWLILEKEHQSNDTLYGTIEEYVPEKLTDPMDFLMEPYEDKKNEKILYDINRIVNKKFIEMHESESQLIIDNEEREFAKRNATAITTLLSLKILSDNKISLAVPGPEGSETFYDLYRVYKITEESQPVIMYEGNVRVQNDNYVMALRPLAEISNFNGELIRAGAAIFQPDAFTTIDDLSKKEIDTWAKMTYTHVKLLGDDLNFRVVIRYFDDVGLPVNGTFTFLMGSLQQAKSIITATGVLLREERFGIIDFTACPFRLQIGILFKEPSLSSVTNIFVLPFSAAVWISIVVMMVLSIIVMCIRAISYRKWFGANDNTSYLSEIGMYTFGAVLQQGFPSSSKTVSDRVAVISLLFGSLILFFAYSASILTFLQSSSSSILTMSDITKSTLEVGIQTKFPHFKVLMKEATHPAAKEYYKKKILNKKGKIYFSLREGIEKIRTGLFAFEIELNAGYKLISQLYQDHEKCGLKSVDLIPKPYICMAVGKTSSFKEVFSRRLAWQDEAGLFDRTWKRWADLKPKCEVERIGFISVGLVEVHPVFWIFLLGLAISILIFFIEIVFHKKLRRWLRRSFHKKLS